jgi:hypothetical protein
MNEWLVALVVLVVVAVSALGGWPLTAGVLRLAARSGDAGTASSGEPGGSDGSGDPSGGDGPTGAGAQAVLRGGTWIGLLERTAVTAALLFGYPPAVAIVVAVKGLGRYPELREHPGSSERFVIGTLASLLWAAGIGVLGRAIIGGGQG